jgi:hypothetical protein
MTEDIAAPGPVTWINLNHGYNVTQFYTVALSKRPGDLRLAGGTQDQGTPYVRLDGPVEPSRDLSGGDGGPVYFATNYVYSSRQYGQVLRLRYNRFDDPTLENYSSVHPVNAEHQRFITPFCIDPSDEAIMYYADGDLLWRNAHLSNIPAGQTNSDGTAIGWTRLSLLQLPPGLDITALAVSYTPAHILYYGASDLSDEGELAPRLYRLDEADTALIGAREISVPDIPPGSYVLDVAVNPENADEILVVHSNYNIDGLFHSLDGGRTYTVVEGNLGGTLTEPGPSLRAAAILPKDGATYYLLGTSTGLYMTANLDADRTVWSLSAADALGNAVVWDVEARAADGLAAVATHGRGLFIGSPEEAFDVRPRPQAIALEQNYPNPFASETWIRFDLPKRSRIHLTVYDVTGRLVAEPVPPSFLGPGSRETLFSDPNLASGLYFYRLDVTPLDDPTAAYSETKSMTLIR